MGDPDLAAGRGKYPCSSRETAPKSLELGCRACVPKLFWLSPALPTCLYLAGKSHPHRASPQLSPALPSQGAAAKRPFCSSPARITGPPGFQRAVSLIGSCSWQKEGGGSCLTGTPGFVLPCSPWGCWRTASWLGLGGCLHVAWLGRKPGVFFSAGWVEEKGGCKLGEKVKHAINKWHPGKEMSVCGSSDTPVPEMGRQMVAIWSIKSAGIRAGTTAAGALPDCGGSKCGCCAAWVVTGNAGGPESCPAAV